MAIVELIQTSFPYLPDSAIVVFFIFLGGAIGSFMEVVRTREYWVVNLLNRSRCTACSAELTFADLVPILSFVLLRGKCRHCKHAIPISAFVAECSMAVAFALSAYFAPSLFMFFALLLIATFLIPIGMTDIERLEIPTHLLIPFLLGVLVLVVVYLFPSLDVVALHLLYGVSLALPFLSIWYITQGKGIGLGDAKLSLPLGLLLSSFIEVVSVFIFTFWVGLAALFVVQIVYLVRGKGWLKGKTEVPLGPSIIVAFLIVFLTGVTVLDALPLFDFFHL